MQYEVKMSRLCIGHTRLIHEHLRTKNNQKPTFGNAACRNQRTAEKNKICRVP